MKKLGALLTSMALIAMVAGVSPAGDEQAWFDLEGCDICKNMGAEKGLMENMKWESHLIANGMLSIAMVSPDYEDAFARAAKGMGETAMKMQQGQPAKLCGFCMSFGKLMMSGAKSEEIHSAAGHINLMTSENPEVVEAIHTHAKRTIDEYEKWKAAEEAKG